MSGSMVRWDLSDCSIPALSPVCGLCVHLRIREGRTCAAFPETDSIPMPIWLGENDHQSPVPGDHGIQFEPVDTEYARQRFATKAPVR